MTDSLVTAELAQEPYRVPTMSVGDVGTFPLDDVSDWQIMTPDKRVRPDTAYVLDL